MNTSSTTFAQTVWPVQSLSSRRLLRDAALSFVFTGMIALLAHLTVPIPGSPVPLTMQTLGVLLTGTLLGARLGGATLVLYLLAGLCGLPVFSPSAHAVTGLSAFALPTFGYLIGFLCAAVVSGKLAERGWDRTPLRMLGLVLAANATIYLCGVAWLLTLPGIGSLPRALAIGVLPFLLGDALKAALAVTMLPAGWQLLSHWKRI